MNPSSVKQLEDWLECVVMEGEPLERLWRLIRSTELPLLTLCSPDAEGLLRLYLEFARVQFASLGKGDAETLGDELIVRLCGVRLVAQALDQPDLQIRQLERIEDWLEGVIHGRRRVQR